MKLTEKKTVINAFDKRPTDSTRLCCICGRPLTKLSLSTNQVSSVEAHFSLKINKFLTVHMCYSINYCYTTLKQRGLLVES